MSERRARRTASAVAVHLLLAALVAEHARAARAGSRWGGSSVVVALTLSVVALTAFAGGLAAGLLF